MISGLLLRTDRKKKRGEEEATNIHVCCLGPEELTSARLYSLVFGPPIETRC